MTDVEAPSPDRPAFTRRRSSYRPPLHTPGGAWGPQRVKVGISQRELERRSGINRYILSFVEQGRMIPTGEEFEKVMGVLRKEEARQEAEKATHSAIPV